MTPQLFQFEGQNVRHIMLDGEPWFVATDVCRALGLTIKYGASQYLQALGADEQTLIKKRGYHKDPRFTRGGSQALTPLFMGTESHLTLLSESGTNKLIMRSEAPLARAMQDWLAREVLPSLRKHGTYSMHGASDTQEPSKATAASSVDLAALVDRYEARTDALIGHIGDLVDLVALIKAGDSSRNSNQHPKLKVPFQ